MITERNSSVKQHRFSEKALFYANPDGKTPAADEKKTFEKRKK